MKTIYLIRHGETEFNREGIVQGGGIDSELNDTGKMQAKLFYDHYKNVPFDKVYTSTLKRAQQTVQQFIDAGIPWERLSGLNEVGWGIYEGSLPTPENKKVFADIIGDWALGHLDAKLEGGESPNEVTLRQNQALEVILSRPEEKTILICMHGRALRMFLCLITGTPLSQMDRFLHQNLSLYELSYEDNKFEVVKFNNVMHLNTQATV